MDGLLFELPPTRSRRTPFREASNDEIIVVGFAGGGGTCEGIKMALGRSPDEALNHNEDAVSMHAVNHPDTRHWCQNIWQAEPALVADGRPIGFAWFSPDCTHFSKAKGGVPRKKHIRDLAWIVVAYAKLPKRIRPRVIMVENVEEFLTWGPLRDDGHPDADQKGETFRAWVAELRRLGYRVEWRVSRASQYGAPTIRKRLAVIARCDGRPIIWPEPSHGAPDDPEVLAGRLQPYRTAANDVIDWSIPCPSIFLTKEEARVLRVKRPLEANTMRRIFAGLKRYVIDHAKPFIIPVTHHGGDSRAHAINEPLRTVTTANGGEFAVVAPYLATMRNAEKPFNGADQPTHTVTAAGAGLTLVVPWMVQQNTGVVGHHVDGPTSTILNTGSHQMLAAASLMKLYGTCRDGLHPDQPMPTVTAGGGHVAEIRAFLTKYYGEGGQDQDCRGPLHTIPTKARFGLVTVHGDPYQIVDIGMRMLTPRELFRAQGFPNSYIIDCGHDGRSFSKAAQIGMCGNSVSPPWAAAHIAANVPEMARADTAFLPTQAAE
ncbi:DNA cytosine methyltransferase [Azospirillum cavernae]|uniref:DNA (cytosine-5-)-methyltransferase n=1 Tax=Azospirillum cavernae TaxID=2320860 RepID=A0A418VUS6_9PROT|nr:DNA cytosine methyltransferase [Azospirillum cavernae]RJF80911.1 DNA cytosine methyltransferase [Azospirillum cavernae]